jgi:UDP-N-acetylglucosamine diphosphorylase/glucosamine-1-phosphate N-acetyltransferase
MNYVVFDNERQPHLLPFTYTRPQAAIRIGILTVAEKWNIDLNTKVSFLTQEYLQQKYPCIKGERNMLISGSILPDKNIVNAIKSLKPGNALVAQGRLIAALTHDERLSCEVNAYTNIEYRAEFTEISNTWDIFIRNGQELERDFERITVGRKSAELPQGNTLMGSRIFIEEGAQIYASVINAHTGPVYIGKQTEIWEGSLIRGGFALLEGASVKMGAKIYGPTTIGPHSRVGGEISNCVIQGYSNKGHDGFLGNSVIGEWCNLGADTNNSNLKNNYAPVKLWDYAEQKMTDTGLQFCGLMMGDHSKCGINTMFNTGTVVGVSANIFGAGFPPNIIPSFTWGGAQGFDEYRLMQAAEAAERMMARRHVPFDSTEQEILTHVFENTASERAFIPKNDER